MSEDAILAEHSGLTREDIREALAYAARCLDSPLPYCLQAREGTHIALRVAAWRWLRERGAIDRRLRRPTRQGILALREHFETKALAELAAHTKEGV